MVPFRIITEEDLEKNHQKSLLMEFLLLATDVKTPAHDLNEKYSEIIENDVDADVASNSYESAIKFRENNLIYH
ncbi:MAG: hypothetical protein V1684_01810 [bacterium]